MAAHLKGVFVSCLLLLILMEGAKPVFAKKQKLSKRVKKLEGSMDKVEDRLDELEECQACTKIKGLNDAINKLKEDVESKPEPADCGDPGVPVHGSKSGQNYRAGGMVTFTCDAGYHLEGPANVVCVENGNWNNALPKCRRICNEPAPPVNGSLLGSEFWEGKNVTYKCNEGYKLQGPTVRVCEESGQWTGEEPTCEPKYAPAVAGLEDSEILKRDARYLEALGDFLKPVVQSGSHWKRCWQATQDDMEAKPFHSLCDDKGPTVTIVSVKNKYIFGGYTSLSWKDRADSPCQWQYDSAAFLYSLVNNPAGWQPVKLYQTGVHSDPRSSSIQTCSTFGPSFGGGHDFAIYVQNSQGSKIFSYSNLGHTYGPPSGYSYHTSFTQSFLAGSEKFYPDEVEVFYEST